MGKQVGTGGFPAIDDPAGDAGMGGVQEQFRGLRPCPFCPDGGKPSDQYIRDGRQVKCSKCFACGPAEFNGPLHMPSASKRAINRWNSRAES